MFRKPSPPPKPDFTGLLVSKEVKAALQREGHDSPNYVVPPDLPKAEIRRNDNLDGLGFVGTLISFWK